MKYCISIHSNLCPLGYSIVPLHTGSLIFEDGVIKDHVLEVTQPICGLTYTELLNFS